MKLLRLGCLAAAAMLLNSCFFAPGKFTSELDLRRGGQFSFSYSGEILFAQDAASEPPALKEQCFGPAPDSSGAPAVVKTPRPLKKGEVPQLPIVTYDERACTPAELRQRAEHRERQRREQAAAMGAVFGFDPLDPASIQHFTSELRKYRGWRSVVHKGGNRFEVDYRISGTLSHDVVFPVFDNVVVHSPFVTIRPRIDGSVEVRAPGFAAGGSLAALGGLTGLRGAMDPNSNGLGELLKSTDGTFTIRTDGEIRANNTAEGPSADDPGKLLSWRILGPRQEAPRALITL